MNLTKKALIGNIIFFLMELVGLIIVIAEGKLELKYYTNWSNVLGIIAATLFIINFFIKEKNIVLNEVLKYFKLISTICLTVTLLVVVFMFVPMDHFNFYKWAIRGNLFSFHLFAPIISLICFIFLERYEFKYIKDTCISMIFTIIYSVVISILILAKKVSAPYPFLDYYAHSVIVNVISITGLLLAIIGLTILFIFIKKKQNNVVK